MDNMLKCGGFYNKNNITLVIYIFNISIKQLKDITVTGKYLKLFYSTNANQNIEDSR
jgi:hypothetical protein